MPTPIESLSLDDSSLKEEIQHLLDGQAAAWNRGDVEGFMTGYWRSPELSFSSGRELFRGWQSTLDRYRKRYVNDGREMGQLALTELQIEPLGVEHAFVRGRCQVTASRDVMSGLITLILHSFPDGWRIIHDHTSA